MAKVAPDGVELVLKEPDPLVQAALLGQDGGLAGQQGAIGAQLLGGQGPHQHLAQGPLAPRHVLLQLLGVFPLPQQEPETLLQRGLRPGRARRQQGRVPRLSRTAPAGPSPPRSPQPPPLSPARLGRCLRPPAPGRAARGPGDCPAAAAGQARALGRP